MLFWEENAKLRGYALVQTPDAFEDQLGTSIELQRPDSSEQEDLIEALCQEKEDMVQMLLNKIFSLEVRVNINKSKFKEMVSGVNKSPFSKRIADAKAPSKYKVQKMKEYRGDLDQYEYVCHLK